MEQQIEVNNFNQIRGLLHFDDGGDLFYFLQIIRRKKDHLNDSIPQQKDSVLIKSYFIDSIEYFNNKEEQIISLCKQHGARAYINLSPCSYEKCTMMLLKECADNIIQKNWRGIRHIIDTVAGKYAAGGDLKAWVVDIDDKSEENLKLILEVIAKLNPLDKDKIIATIPTLHGYHVITRPFDLLSFSRLKPEIVVHKNNPTLLYYYGTDS